MADEKAPSNEPKAKVGFAVPQQLDREMRQLAEASERTLSEVWAEAGHLFIHRVKGGVEGKKEATAGVQKGLTKVKFSPKKVDSRG